MSTRAEQIDSLTPLRGIAAILVVIYHLSSVSFLFQISPLLTGTGFIERGYLWVDFFFVLSGFIITHVYGDRFTEGRPKGAIRDYLVARFSRLYPLHFVALCITVLLYVGVFSKMPPPKGGGAEMMNIYPWGALPFHFVWLIGFGLTDMTWNVPAWSIATEWWTYLIAVPLFPLLNRGISKRTFVLPLLCSAGLWVLISHHKTHTLNITFDFGLVRCLLSFTIGICLYQLYRANHLKQILQKDVALLGAGVLTFLTLHFPNPAYLPPPAPGQFPVANPLTPPFDAISPLVFALLILCAAYNRGLGHRILNAKPLRYLGDISFSVYLMQVTIFILFMGGAGAWRKSHPTGDMDFGTKILLYGVTVLVDILVAAITFRFIEKPARGWFRRMLSTK